MVIIVFIESQVMLSPSGDVSVCPGGQLSFRCSTNLRFLEWNITVFRLGRSDSKRQLVTTVTELELDLMISGQAFNNIITRNSALNLLPLISMLTISNTLAANKIKCTEIGSSLVETSTSVATLSNISGKL